MRSGTKFFTFSGKYFPSGKNIYLVFSVAAFPIHSWLFIVFLYHFPALIKKGSIWQVIGVFAYSFSLALIESVCLTAFIILIIGIIPISFLKERFVFFGTSLALIFSGWAIIINIQGQNVQSWLLLPLITIIFFIFVYSIVRPTQTIKATSLAERLTVLSTLFLTIDLICIIIIVFRNLFQLFT